MYQSSDDAQISPRLPMTGLAGDACAQVVRRKIDAGLDDRLAAGAVVGTSSLGAAGGPGGDNDATCETFSSPPTAPTTHMDVLDCYANEFAHTSGALEMPPEGCATDGLPTLPAAYDDSLVVSGEHTSGDGSFGTLGVDTFDAGQLGKPLRPSATPADDAVDSTAYPYWYGRNATAPLYQPGYYNMTTYNRAVPRYQGYCYTPSYPYYSAGLGVYGSGYAGERKPAYQGSYGVPRDSMPPHRASYPMYPSPRRGVTVAGASFQPASKMPAVGCYGGQPDGLYYNSWASPVNAAHDPLVGCTAPSGSILPGVAFDGQPSQLESHFDGDNFYAELSGRLRHELKKKRSLGHSGRPKMNRNNYVCAICNAKSTPQWRYVKGNSVCNACYMRIRKQKMKQLKQAKEEEELQLTGGSTASAVSGSSGTADEASHTAATE